MPKTDPKPRTENTRARLERIDEPASEKICSENVAKLADHPLLLFPWGENMPKKNLFFVAAFLIMPVVVSAEDETQSSLLSKTAGSFGLVAVFPGIFQTSDLDFPKSYEVGVQWHVLDFLVLKIMASYFLTNSNSSTGTYSGRQVFGGGLDGDFIFFKQPMLSLYAGVGGRIYYGAYFYNSNEVFFVACHAEVGVQVNLFKFFSLFAETGVEFNYTMDQINSVRTNTYDVNSLGAVVGLILYLN
jgi:hypothetical protein